MDARILRAATLAAALLSCGANWRSQNFIIVSASSNELAQEVVAQAEHYRRELAIEWLGRELPPWREPCPIAVGVGPREPSRGKTTFIPTGGVPYGWQMEVFGTRERVLDSVLPHEILHTVFASHFGVPLPRWADEGACTTVEHDSERSKQEHNLIHYLKNERGIAFNKMFAMKEYPRDMLPLYAQGYSVARFLIAHGGKRKFVDFVGDGLSTRSWTGATQRHYGYQSLAELQKVWLAWVQEGSPPLSPHAEPSRQQLADSDPGSIKSQLARVRGGDALATDSRPSAPPPSTFSPTGPAPQTSVARPESGGWYKRQRAEGTRAPVASQPEPVIRGQEPDLAPPREQQAQQQQGSAAGTGPIQRGVLIPLRPAARTIPVSTPATAGASQVVMEWTRPKDQPWQGAPAMAEVALRSEPRLESSSPRPAVEQYDAPLDSTQTIWR